MLELELSTVSNTYVKNLIRLVGQYGIAAERLLEPVGLAATDLDHATGRINARLAQQLWQRAITLTGDQALGIRLAQHFKLASFRTLGIAAMSSATLFDSMQIVLRYHRLVSDVGSFSSDVKIEGDVLITYTEQLKSFHLLPQQIEAIIGSLLSQARLLCEQPITAVSVKFRHKPQVDESVYQAFFGVMPEFETTDDQIVFSKADMLFRLPHTDLELCQIHCDMAERQLVQLPVTQFISTFAVQWLNSSGRLAGMSRIGHLAQAMQLSTRTLQRLLAEEGKSWTEVVDAARCAATKKMLQQDLPLEYIAQHLGYHDASSLSRAAKRWFGMTAGQWQAAQKA